MMNKAKKSVTVLAAASLCCVLLTACGSTKYYTADDCVEVSVKGVNGNGKASVYFADDDLISKISQDVYKGKADEMELAKAQVALYEYVDLDVLDDTDNLSNGDTIIINVSADNDALKKAGMNFGIDPDKSVYVYTVTDLEEPTVLDLFSDVTINVEGISPKLTVKAEYTGNDDFIKSNVTYYADSSYFANGDTVTVKANVPEYKLTENNYIVEAAEKEFELSGYDKYADKDSDLTAAYDYIDDYAHSAAKDGGTYGLNWENDARAFFKDGSAYELWTIRKEEITPVKVVLYTKDNSSSWSQNYNSYNIFYRIDMEIEKTGTRILRPNTGYEIGDKESSEIYFCVALNNIVEKPDGTIEFDEDDRNIITYSTSLMYNYVGADLDEVAAARDKDMSGYTRDELEVK